MSALWPELVRESLARGLTVRCVAPGQSMEPAIRDGETIVVRPLAPGDLTPGAVVLCRAGGRLLAHRIVRVRGEGEGVTHVTTRGDAVASPDQETDASSVLGRVIAVTRGAGDEPLALTPGSKPILERLREGVQELRAVARGTEGRALDREGARRIGRLLAGSWRRDARAPVAGTGTVFTADARVDTSANERSETSADARADTSADARADTSANERVDTSASARADLSPDELDALVPLLHRSGCAPLAWYVLRGTSLAELPAGQLLRRDYLAQAAMAVLRESQIQRALGALRAAGIEPLVSKGWAVARHYAESGLRPAADVDLFVAPEAFADAERLFEAPALEALRVDLHAGFPDLPDRTFSEIAGRARVVDLGGTPVRVPAPDDLLRHVCLHLLRHAAWRPLWLADIGALLDATAATLDWDRLRSGSALHTGWVARTLSLATGLVGAPAAPWEAARAPVPPWLEAAVLDHWIGGDVHLYDGVPLAELAFRRGFFRALARRWPSPLMASVDRGAPFDHAPRFPLQLADFALRGVDSLRRASRRLSGARERLRTPGAKGMV